MIDEKDLKIEIYRVGGVVGYSMIAGPDSAVRVTHIPTGLQVVAQDSRSPMTNKNHAIAELEDMLRVRRYMSYNEQESSHD